MWSWSFSNEGLDNISHNIHTLTDNELCEVWAEWHSYFNAYGPRNERMREEDMRAPFSQRSYREGLKEARRLVMSHMQEYMCDQIYEWAGEHNTCENGGWEAMICPYDCHTVSLDREEIAA